MTQNSIEHDYFEWMYGIACGDRFSQENSYRKLLNRLHEIEFIYSIPKDYNRADDGIRLRYRFGYFNGIPHAEDYIGGPCSVLEMILALAIRCEEQIMDDPSKGDRTGHWFWKMINNLGLGGMYDRRFDIDYVDRCVDRFLAREYDADGRGGLFTVRNYSRDMRRVEIWTQLMRFIEQY